MKNSEKTELRRDIKDLVKKGYSKEEAIKVLVDYGYCKSTAKKYWEIFSEKYAKANLCEEGGEDGE